MTTLPISPNLTAYRGRNEARRREVQADNAIASRVAWRANMIIANDPAELQRLDFASIARDLGLSIAEVRQAIGGGDNGMSVRVMEQDRRALEIYRAKPGGPSGRYRP